HFQPPLTLHSFPTRRSSDLRSTRSILAHSARPVPHPFLRARSETSDMPTARASLLPADRFVTRHIGPSPDETRAMLQTVGCASPDRKSTRLNSSHEWTSYAV